MNVFHEFPKWKYHAEKEAVIVHTAEEEAALGGLWVDSPADVTPEIDAALIERIDEIIHPKKKRAKA